MKEKEEQRLINLKEIEENLYKEKNLQYICGIDEAGRGPLAGPVVVAAVIMPKDSMIEGVNDSKKEADEIVKLLKGMLCHVNLIPINKIENGKYTKSTNDNIIKFRDYLNDNGIVATIRRELGSDIDAACGQLRRAELKKE